MKLAPLNWNQRISTAINQLSSAGVLVGAAVMLTTFAVSAATSAFAMSSEQELLSSIMWQVSGTPAERFLYPPGLPAVLRATTRNRVLRVEQYYAQPLSKENFTVKLHGSWTETPDNAVAMLPDLRMEGRYVKLSAPVCDTTGSENGFLCYVDITLAPETPSGTIGLSIRPTVRTSK